MKRKKANNPASLPYDGKVRRTVRHHKAEKANRKVSFCQGDRISRAGRSRLAAAGPGPWQENGIRSAVNTVFFEKNGSLAKKTASFSAMRREEKITGLLLVEKRQKRRENKHQKEKTAKKMVSLFIKR